ncbi:hypothetical protein EUX98_g5747 [Antrodiella citrinella]|uniref:GH16 domain-containing protein n=1 Tax=Antrodiella citrinella TaxID=2447956 RepID=A0A4S4MQN9_9APHY|nr:hypothetical protein EUX98_g5747 [Antrodiella citrinella]
MLSLYLALIASIVPTALAGAYAITDTYVGSAFLSSFVHENILDPTHGRVNYLDQATAVSLNLTYAQGNTGCGVQVTTANSYGPSFNSVGGGFYAMERTDSFIKVWFWQRGDGSTPGDMEFGATSVNTDTWGQPSAFFPNTECDIGAHFGPNNVIINTSLCGDWAGIPSVFNGAGCPGDCNTFVDQNPSTFVNAYWEINAIRVYT